MYYFYMGSVLLPIAPQKFTLKVKNTNKTVTLINEGEVNLMKEAGLTELEFDTLIPAVQYSFAAYDGGFKSPTYYTSHFEKLKLEKKSFQFIIVRKMPDGKLLFDTNMTVSLESYTIKEDANEGFDMVVSFKLKQYKSFGTKVIKITEPEKPKPVVKVETPRPAETSPAPKKQEVTHTVKKGDSMWAIAQKYYNKGSRYPEIYAANKELIDSYNRKYKTSKYTIYPNQVFVIPSL